MKRMLPTVCLAASLLIAVGCGKEGKDQTNAGREVTTGTSRSDPKADDVAEEPAAVHLRVVSFAASVEGKRRAEDVVAFLTQHGIRDAQARLSVGEAKHWVVDIGSFESATDKAALELKNKVAGLQRPGYRFPRTYFVTY